MYLLWPSAYKVSNAKVDLPLPDNPVNTTKDSLGIVTLTFFKLFSLAPLITIFFSISVFILAS